LVKTELKTRGFTVARTEHRTRSSTVVKFKLETRSSTVVETEHEQVFYYSEHIIYIYMNTRCYIVAKNVVTIKYN